MVLSYSSGLIFFIVSCLIKTCHFMFGQNLKRLYNAMLIVICKTNAFTRKSIILITSFVVCLMDTDLHSIAVDSGQHSQFSCKGFLSLAGFFNNHLSLRYGFHSTDISFLLLRVTKPDLYSDQSDFPCFAVP